MHTFMPPSLRPVGVLCMEGLPPNPPLDNEFAFRKPPEMGVLLGMPFMGAENDVMYKTTIN